MAAGVPTGSVRFHDGDQLLGVVALDDTGEARLTTTELAVGDHEIRVEYNGDANFAPTTGALDQTVGRTTTSTTLTSSAVSATFGQVVTFEATVSAEGLGVPTGTVTFRDGTATLATIPLDLDGVARLDANLGWGSHALSAIYSGDATFGPSVTTINQLIQAHTMTSLSVKPTRSTFGDAVALTATVRSPAPGDITGQVTFGDGTRTIGSMPLSSSGEARVLRYSLGAGDHTLTAHYGGDTHFGPSAAETTHHVEKAATSALLSVSVAPTRPPARPSS
jgi:hypothetical protein